MLVLLALWHSLPSMLFMCLSFSRNDRAGRTDRADRGGRDGKRGGRGGGKGPREKQVPKTGAELDAEMDVFMKVWM
jgi:hypothetical protein